ncbi:Citrate synthase C terminal domain [Trypanosoma vivax]|uniref:Citrate synthase n=1 Tax=Trypanosoma vivax (strain Y486) TaxID=1055687 RepID=G0U495_TRYVY|nr:Citrate synthase C terminal domain [Trypanosoma vivax]CCC52258.1 putative citrate synthase [Trypanosoma vivax Y486]
MLREFFFTRRLLCGCGVTASGSNIVDELKSCIVAKRDLDAPKIKQLRENHGNEKLSEATVNTAYSGMRGVISNVYEPSLLDNDKGICFRGNTIAECCECLPKSWLKGSSPLPEGLLWLLLTGSFPEKRQVKELSAELHRRANSEAAEAARRVIAALPEKTHPMTQLSTGVMALQSYSKFAAAYSSGKATKRNYWEYVLEDSLDLIARSPHVAAVIYNRLLTGNVSLVAPPNKELDWAANFTSMLGFTNEDFWDCMRLYLCLHADHEGGNVSAHTTTLVASALSDPYLALAAGLNGLAGPLHGLANQEVLIYLFELRQKCKDNQVAIRHSDELTAALEKFTWETLNSGRVVPGYGHAVLRTTDTRYLYFRELCKTHLPENELFILVETLYSIMPGILKKHGKVKSPFPNVDANSALILQHYGLTEKLYYTVLFGLSRQIGVLSAIVWDRLSGRPIERPKSVTSEFLFKKFSVS